MCGYYTGETVGFTVYIIESGKILLRYAVLKLPEQKKCADLFYNASFMLFVWLI